MGVAASSTLGSVLGDDTVVSCRAGVVSWSPLVTAVLGVDLEVGVVCSVSGSVSNTPLNLVGIVRIATPATNDEVTNELATESSFLAWDFAPEGEDAGASGVSHSSLGVFSVILDGRFFRSFVT